MGQELTRRGFFGHAAGAYTAVALVGGGALVVSEVQNLIGRHQRAFAEWNAASQAETEAWDRQAEDHAERAAARAAAREHEKAALLAVLSHVPADLDELREVLAYMTQTEHLWGDCCPEEWEMNALIGAVMAANA